MADLYYTVYEGAAEVAVGPILHNKVNIGVASAQSAPIPGTAKRHKRVRIMADGNCFVNIGENPTAAADGTSGWPMGAENPEYFDIAEGDRIAVIQR